MQTVEVLCPSGLKGVLRGMRVREEGLFGNKALMRQHQIIDKLLECCWEQTLDPGPYRLDGEGKLNWSMVAATDRVYAMLQLRILTYRADYTFRVTCKTCDLVFPWTVELDALDVIDMAEEGIHNLQTGEPYIVELGNGSKVACRVLRGEDEVFLATSKQSDETALAAQLARRVVRIGDATAWDDVLSVVSDLPAGHADDLRTATDDIEGGVETTFDVKCSSCGGIQRVLLPFEADFFSTQKVSSKSQRRRSRKTG